MIEFGNTKNDKRERVFQMLFSVDFHEISKTDDRFLSFYEDTDIVPDGGYIRDTFTGAVSFATTADARIEADSKNWKASRLSGVTRSILRLAIYELLNTKTPPKVVISEAVNLAKKYGDQQEPGFINGILNRIAREDGLI